MITRMPAWQKAEFVINICTNGLTVSHLSLLYGHSFSSSWQDLPLILWLRASEGSQLFRELLGSSRSVSVCCMTKNKHCSVPLLALYLNGTCNECLGENIRGVLWLAQLRQKVCSGAFPGSISHPFGGHLVW